MPLVLYLSRPWFPYLHAAKASPYGVYPQVIEDAVVDFSKKTWAAAGVEPRAKSGAGRLLYAIGARLFSYSIPLGVILAGVVAWRGVRPEVSLFLLLFSSIGMLIGGYALMAVSRWWRLRPPAIPQAVSHSSGATGRHVKRLGVGVGVLSLLLAPFGVYLAGTWGTHLSDHVSAPEFKSALDQVGPFLFLMPPLLFVLVGVLTFRLGQRLSQPSADELRAADSRKPVLFLRSFRDEELFVAMGTDRDGHERRERFEEAIVPLLSPFGPVVAIGKPGDKLPELGASRNYYSDDEWREAVNHWLGEALLVVMIAGSTKGLEWELNAIAKEGHLSKLILLMPPLNETANQARWSLITAALGADLVVELPTSMPKRTRGLYVAGRDNAVILETLGNDATSYATAIWHAVYGMFCQPS